MAKILTSVLLSAFLVAGAGCGDRTLDDYQRDKVNENLSRIQAISGTYSGTISNADTKVPFGAFSIQLTPDTTVTQNNDKTGPIQIAKIRGKVTYEGTTKAVLVFQNADYDWDRNTIKASFTVDNNAMDLTGKIENGHLTGELEAEAYPDNAATFDVTLNAPAADAQAIVSAHPKTPLNPGDALSARYEADANLWDRTTTDHVSLTISKYDLTNEEQFFTLLTPVSFVTVSLRPTENMQPYASTAVQWDVRTQSFRAALTPMTSTGGGARVTINLVCKQAPDAKSGQYGWRCSASSSVTGPIFSNVLLLPLTNPGSDKGKDSGK